MLARYIFAAIAGLAASASAAPAHTFPSRISPRQATTIELGAIALAGDPTCPASTDGTVNANVFVVAQLREVATLTLNTQLAVLDGLTTVLLPPGTAVTAAADAFVCLCANPAISVGDIPTTANLNAEALANIEAAARASTDVTLSALANALGTTGLVGVTAELTPVAATPCGNCPDGQTTTCTNGACGCATLPTASQGARARVRSLPPTSDKIRRKQAKRADVAKRLAVKKL